MRRTVVVLMGAAAVALVLLLLLAATQSERGLDDLMGSWASSKATGGDRDGLRGAQDRLRVAYVDDAGGSATRIGVNGAVAGRRLSCEVGTDAWSAIGQELRLELDDGRWTLEVDAGLLVVRCARRRHDEERE
jgi:hypothetical protein